MYVHVCTCIYMYVHVRTCMYMYIHTNGFIPFFTTLYFLTSRFVEKHAVFYNVVNVLLWFFVTLWIRAFLKKSQRWGAENHHKSQRCDFDVVIFDVVIFGIVRWNVVILFLWTLWFQVTLWIFSHGAKITTSTLWFLIIDVVEFSIFWKFALRMCEFHNVVNLVTIKNTTVYFL